MKNPAMDLLNVHFHFPWIARVVLNCNPQNQLDIAQDKMVTLRMKIQQWGFFFSKKSCLATTHVKEIELCSKYFLTFFKMFSEISFSLTKWSIVQNSKNLWFLKKSLHFPISSKFSNCIFFSQNRSVINSTFVLMVFPTQLLVQQV